MIICQFDLLSPRCVWSGLKGKNEHLEINARFWFSTVEHKVSGILKTATFYPMWDLTFFVWSTMVKLTIILIWRNERRASEHLFCIFQNLIRIEVIEKWMWLEWRMLCIWQKQQFVAAPFSILLDRTVRFLCQVNGGTLRDNQIGGLLSATLIFICRQLWLLQTTTEIKMRQRL